MRHVLAIVVCAGLAGCSAAGEPGGEQTFSNDNVPFTFALPADFTKASIDQGSTRGDVVAAAGVSKVDVIAVRRETDVVVMSRGGVQHRVLGQRVTSELHKVPGFAGWTLECQYTADRAEKLRRACARALATIRAH